MKKQKGNAGLGLLLSIIIVLAWLAGIVGWAINLVSVIKLAIAAAPLTTLFIVKVIGIFVAPLGSLLGLFF